MKLVHWYYNLSEMYWYSSIFFLINVQSNSKPGDTETDNFLVGNNVNNVTQVTWLEQQHSLYLTIITIKQLDDIILLGSTSDNMNWNTQLYFILINKNKIKINVYPTNTVTFLWLPYFECGIPLIQCSLSLMLLC